MSDLPPVYLATVNVPGYLPMADEPSAFDTADAAWLWLSEERERGEDQDANTPEYSDTWSTLRYIASGDHEHGAWGEDTRTNANGSGTVYGATPGYEGDHDLGLAYSVIRINHHDYPHHAGYLSACPACYARCYCDGESAECVYGGDHG